MAGIEAEVLQTFLAELTNDSDVDPSVASRLGDLLAAAKLPKPDQLADLYSKIAGEQTL